MKTGRKIGRGVSFLTHLSPQCQGIRNPGNFCLWNLETWGLESGIQFKEYGISLTIKARNPSSTAKACLESSTWKPESKTVYLTWGDNHHKCLLNLENGRRNKRFLRVFGFSND